MHRVVHFRNLFKAPQYVHGGVVRRIKTAHDDGSTHFNFLLDNWGIVIHHRVSKWSKKGGMLRGSFWPQTHDSLTVQCVYTHRTEICRNTMQVVCGALGLRVPMAIWLVYNNRRTDSDEMTAAVVMKAMTVHMVCKARNTSSTTVHRKEILTSVTWTSILGNDNWGNWTSTKSPQLASHRPLLDWTYAKQQRT